MTANGGKCATYWAVRRARTGADSGVRACLAPWLAELRTRTFQLPVPIIAERAGSLPPGWAEPAAMGGRRISEPRSAR